MNRRINLGKDINFNIIETSKFKSNVLAYYIVRPLNREEVTRNALLPIVLRRGTENYRDNLTVHRRLEELYGAKLSVGVLVRGNKQVIRIALEFVDDKYIEDENYLDGILEMLEEVIYRPRLDGISFNKEIIKKEKKNLKTRIESKINDKRDYAIDRAIEIMCKDDSFSIPNLGYVEDLEEINGENLYSHYLDILRTSPMEIFYTGTRSEKIEDFFVNKDFLERGEILSFQRENVPAGPVEVKDEEEILDINQGKLVLAYRTGIPYEDRLYNALLVANVIFGGGSNSKLFLNVRERESLAYYVVSRVYKYKSILMVDGGIEFHQLEKTKKIIAEELEKMKSGDFTEREIEIAKKAMISGLNSVDDSAGSLTELEFDNLVSGDERTIDEKIQDIESVTREEIIEASRQIELDTIFFLKDSLEGEE